MKYIIVPTGAILFNEGTVHAMVAHGFKELKQEILSAGFCTLEYIGISSIPEVKCYGESDSLKLKSLPEVDNRIVRDLFNPMSEIKYFGLNVKELYDLIR